MRQGQQNRRGRGRGRKVQNPLNRNYESNGPEVKIRGNASHIAEKYAALARDALAAGDTITAENFLQHAEHYNRIIMAAQQNSGAQGSDGANGSGNQRGQSDHAEQSDEAETVEASQAEADGDDADDSGKGNGRGRGGNRKKAEEEVRSSDDAASDNTAI